MDSFTESILARARERQKLLEGYSSSKSTESTSPTKPYSSQPNLTNGKDKKDSTPNQKFKTSSEGNINFNNRIKQNSTTRVSSEITSSPKSQLKTLNIQNDNFNMEIKVSSAENVRVEVQIEEQGDDSDHADNGNDTGLLRPDAKNRLNRLGKLYAAGGDDADISSPIHRTEAKFHAKDEEDAAEEQQQRKDEGGRKGLRKLADLAQNINEWEDEITKSKPVEKQAVKKSWKPRAPPPPPSSAANSPVKKTKAPSPPKVVNISPKKSIPGSPKKSAPSSPKKSFGESPRKNKSNSKVQWDKKVLDSLESQGFTRTESSSRLVYQYKGETKQNKENLTVVAEEKPKSPQKSTTRTNKIADKAAIFESSIANSPTKQKDPALLSVSERKALFEKNKGSALIPKSAFGMAAPVASPKSKLGKTVPAPKPPTLSSAKEIEVRPIVHQAGNIANKVAALLEGKTTISQEQIESGVKEQRQKEMDMLLNRFHKANDDIQEEDENAIEELDETDDDNEEVDEKTAMISSEKDKAKVVTLAPIENRRSSGNKRCSKADSPKVAAVLSDVKRIKVQHKQGRLYPSLTDIESQTETENENYAESPTPNNSSFEGCGGEESDDAMNTSFGRDILRAVCQKSQTPQKRQIPSNISTASSDLSSVLDDLDDDYIDEALAYNNGPTPPKQGRHSPVESSHSFNYKKFEAEEFKSPMKKPPTPSSHMEQNPIQIVDGNNVLPLTHTVSFYRKQQSQSNNSTPVRQLSRQPIVEDINESSSSGGGRIVADDEMEKIKQKCGELKNEVSKQEMIISQTSQALNLCNSTPEFMGSTEQVEAERVLLVATHRRQAALHELQRLNVEKKLRPLGHNSNLPLEKGTLTISKIVLPLKQKYVTALAAAGGKGHHVVCLIKYGEQVLPTPLVSTVATSSKNPDFDLNIPGSIKIKNVYSDFTITFEVYCLQAQEEILPHEIKYHIKKPSSKLTPKKNKQDANRLMRPIKESPAGPQAVRSPTFALMGYVVFSVEAVNKKQWSLNNTPSMSPLDGTVEMAISCELALSVEHRGFLTMFEDVSGFGAWHRRWCLLKGHILSYWKYPDDERKTAPINSINLKNCITKTVGPVSRDICARLHTFLFEVERIAYPQDKNTLVTICKGDKTIIRHLLSADTKEERIEWCNQFNAALTALNTWGREHD